MLNRILLMRVVCIFFNECGRLVPESARCQISFHNLFVHEQTARIFAFHFGRFTFMVRPDFAGSVDLSSYSSDYQCTLDGYLDVTSLDPDWIIYDDSDIEEVQQVYLEAYELAGRDAVNDY